MTLYLAYLRSGHQKMGAADVTCTRGCTCTKSKLDGSLDRNETVVYLQGMEVSQHGGCTIRVAVSNSSSTGEHRFKVTGIIMQDAAAASAGITLGSWIWIEGRHHRDTFVGR